MSIHEKLQPFLDRWCKNDECEKLLFHYSDLNSSHSMLLKNSVWFSYVRHSNDTQEFSAGIDMIIQELKNDKTLEPFIHVEGVIEFLEKDKRNPEIKPLIFCVSEKSDQLSQWRGYANFGKGLSLGFKADSFRSHDNCFLRKVVYDAECFKVNIRKILDEYVTIMTGFNKEGLLKDDSKDLRADIISSVIQTFYTAALTYKNKKFSEEKEWRWIMIPNPLRDTLQTRVKSNEKIVIYREAIFQKDSLRKIVFGPIASKNSETKDSIKVIKNQSSYDFDIRRSKIPFHS
jgi:hypothetical protein